MDTFTLLVLAWGIGALTGRMLQYYIDGQRN